MITLNDYLYSGRTVLRILRDYSRDLRKESSQTGNPIDVVHSNFLLQMIDLLEHNDFLTSQSQRIRSIYEYMTKKYPRLAFTFKGRIKSLIRAEEKFNGNIVENIYDYYVAHGCIPPVSEMKAVQYSIRDLIAYRIVISMPKLHLRENENRISTELDILYGLAEELPDFLELRGFSTLMPIAGEAKPSKRLNDAVSAYYKDYVENPGSLGYQSLHINFFDNIARSTNEVQLRTKDMDDYAEIGAANHEGYEKQQKRLRRRRELIPEGTCSYFDEAFERGTLLQNLDLTKVDVNMFAAADNGLVNDGCGFYKGRLILPFEHLSEYQND